MGDVTIGDARVALRPRLAQRLLSRNAAVLLARNTVVSCVVFAVGLGLLWLLVERLSVKKVLAAAISFLAANTLHYAFGRAWIYRGSHGGMALGYAYFLANTVVGLTITTLLFAALLRWTPVHYLVARILVSLVAGLAMFVLNATLNFRKV